VSGSDEWLEAKSNLLVMQARASGLTQAQRAMMTVQPTNAEVVADSLITALQLAHAIISEEDPSATSVAPVQITRVSRCFKMQNPASEASEDWSRPLHS
jgi:hypothetical protein